MAFLPKSRRRGTDACKSTETLQPFARLTLTNLQVRSLPTVSIRKASSVCSDGYKCVARFLCTIEWRCVSRTWPTRSLHQYLKEDLVFNAQLKIAPRHTEA